MRQFVVHEINPDVQVRVTRAMPELPRTVDATVEHLWRRAGERVAAGGAGRMFNGRVFSIDELTPHSIRGHLTEYRRLVAQMEDPDLFADLGIRSLAVCGALCCAGGVVIGRRPPAAVYQPGMWQLPPAGSVDANAMRPDGSIDLHGQLLTELREELGLAAGDVGASRPLCIVEHPGSHVSDMGLALITPLDAAAVLAAHRHSTDAEYDPLVVVPFGEVLSFVTNAGDALVPPAREFLIRLGLLPRRMGLRR